MPNQVNAQQTEPTIEPTEPDYKALYEKAQADAEKWKSLSRKNESKAKANGEAAANFEQLTEQMKQLTEQMQSIQSERDALKAAEERRVLVEKVATDTNLPVSVIGALSGADEDALMEQAKSLKQAIPTYPTRRDDGGSSLPSTTSNAQRFGEILSNALGN